MKLNYSRVLLTVALIFAIKFGFAQSNEIKIEFIGNCGLYMTDGTTNIYADFPYKSGAYNYMEFDKAELDSIKENSIFIFTHKHADHFSENNMRKVLKEKEGLKFTPWKSNKLIKYFESIPELHIKVFKTKHAFSIKHVSYLITWHGKKIFLSGDTTNAETIGEIKNIDWAFVPYWLLLDARDKEIEIDAKMKGIYHWATVQVPSAEENYDNGKDLHPLTKPGEIIKIPYY